MFDSRTPAPSVRVDPTPRAKVYGLTAEQRRKSRTLCFEYSVMRPKPLCQPVKTRGGGQPSSVVIAKGDTRSHNHRRRSPKMRSHNRCFGPGVPTMYQDMQREAQAQVDRMWNIYQRCVRVCRRELDDAYECLRMSFYRLHREFFWMVKQMETQVEGENRA
jgi:hypothetical protein